jgi:hypothetical protein
MVLVIAIWIIRLILSIVIGFYQADMYDIQEQGYEYYKGNKTIIYINKKFFLIWMIPFLGWLWLLIYQTRKFIKEVEFFNE